MTWGAVAGAAAVVVGGYLSSNASKNAANAQAQAAKDANKTQLYEYNQTRADAAPYRAAGNAALSRLSAGLAPGGQFVRRFSMSDLNSDPVYKTGLQFGLNEGEKALNHQASATGSLLSGATLKALTRYGNDYGSTKAGDAYNRYNTDETNIFNRLSGVSGTGQTANALVASSGANMANNVSANQIGAGNARASGYIGQANAVNNVIGQGYNAYQDNRLMNRLYPTSSTSAQTYGYADEKAPSSDTPTNVLF